MSKIGLKTFIYSFLVSLFAIFVANGVYWHASPKTKNQVKIPHKNVALFLRSEPMTPSNLAVPVKKISLSILPGIKAIEPEETEIIMADDPELDAPRLFDDDFIVYRPDIQFDIAQGETHLSPPIYEPKKNGIPVLPDDISSNIVEHKTMESPTADEKAPFIPIETQVFAEIDTSTKQHPLILADHDIAEKHNEAELLFVPIEKNEIRSTDKKIKIKIDTPEGLNQVALTDASIPVNSMNTPEADTPSQEIPAAEDTDTPTWLVAKAKGTPKNKKIEESKAYSAEVPMQDKKEPPKPETAKNLLIPIPEEILNTENLIPKLSISPATSQENTTFATEEKNTKSATSGVLESLENIFASKNKLTDKANANNTVNKPNKQAQKKKVSLSGKIIPVEMRLSFQPNRAEISGQTLRWVQAFASKVANNENLSIEIRIDGASATELQQRRLNLLHNILANKGVQYSKINTVFTQREPNSFILRTLTLNNKGANRKLNKSPTTYYQQW